MRASTRRAAAALALLLAAGAAGAQELGLGQSLKAAFGKSRLLAAAGLEAGEAAARRSEAFYKRFPSLAFSAGYTRLSELAPGSFSARVMGNPISVQLPAALSDAVAFRLDFQLPLFSGFRLEENAAAAGLEEKIKRNELAAVRRSLDFEVRRTYWEALKSELNMDSMKKSLDLVRSHLDEMNNLSESGLATRADVLSIEMQRDQTELALAEAEAARASALLGLADLVGAEDYRKLVLTEKPIGPEAALAARLPEAEERLVARALAERPELKNAALMESLAGARKAVARSDLWPSLLLSGNYTLARPNQRQFPQTEDFTGSWEAGVMARVEIGGWPAGLARSEAAELAERRAGVSRQRLAEAVTLEVRRKELAFERGRLGVGLSLRTVEQSRESLRVIEDKLKNGLAKRTDVLEAELALARAELAVSLKTIDLEIAAADLDRAAALGER